MKFVKKPVQNGGKMFFIAYQREDGTERICTEVGLSEAFPEERATKIVEALNKSLGNGTVNPDEPIDIQKILTSEEEIVKDSESQNVVLEQSEKSHEEEIVKKRVAPKKSSKSNKK